jgi:hypothetical protein
LATVITFSSQTGMHRGGFLAVSEMEVPTSEKTGKKRPRDRAEVSVVVASGGSEGRVRLWRFSADFTIKPAADPDATDKPGAAVAAEADFGDSRAPYTESGGRTWRLVLDKKKGVS